MWSRIFSICRYFDSEHYIIIANCGMQGRWNTWIFVKILTLIYVVPTGSHIFDAFAKEILAARIF